MNRQPIAPATDAMAAPAEQSARGGDVVRQSPELGECAVCLLPVAEHFTGPHGSGTNIGCCGARRASTLFDRHIAKAFGFGLTQFYKRKKAGDFRWFELDPQFPDSNTRYSGAKVQRCLDGDSVASEPVAGSREYFRTARPQQDVARLAVVQRGPGRPRKVVI